MDLAEFDHTSFSRLPDVYDADKTNSNGVYLGIQICQGSGYINLHSIWITPLGRDTCASSVSGMETTEMTVRPLVRLTLVVSTIVDVTDTNLGHWNGNSFGLALLDILCLSSFFAAPHVPSFNLHGF
jgi:hypothetical protein